VLELIDRSEPPGVKNTSGKAFLHVLRVEDASQLPKYLQVLIKAQEQGYSLSAKDFRGINVRRRFSDWNNKWERKHSEIEQSLYDSTQPASGEVLDLDFSTWDSCCCNEFHTLIPEEILKVFTYQVLQLFQVNRPTFKS
jgi:hypothetical protein